MAQKKYKDVTRESAIKQIKSGKTQIQVANAKKIPRSTIWSWCKQEGLVTPLKKVKAVAKSVSPKKTKAKVAGK